MPRYPNTGFAEGGDDLADDAKRRQDQDVDFRMAEEPEQMLEQQRIAAAFRVEKGGAEVAVGQQHGDPPASTGSDSSSRKTVTRIDHTNSGILCRVMPGARMLKIVVMKLIDPRIDETPAR